MTTQTKVKHVGVLVFPGSNCDRDAGESLKSEYGDKVRLEYLWHKNTFEEKDFDLIIVPGGFSYGDYLRSGAMARFSLVMDSVLRYAEAGRHLLGICNGFQILCEAHLLPGALTRNRDLKHIARYVDITRVNKDSIYTKDVPDQKLSIPVSHSEGAYFIDEAGLNELKANGQIAFRYEENINGSVDNIAGVLNKEKNIMGMMPHPERALQYEKFVDTDGRYIFDSIFG